MRSSAAPAINMTVTALGTGRRKPSPMMIAALKEWFAGNALRLEQKQVAVTMGQVSQGPGNNVISVMLETVNRGAGNSLWEDGQCDFEFLDWSEADLADLKENDLEIRVTHHDFANAAALVLGLEGLIAQLTRE